MKLMLVWIGGVLGTLSAAAQNTPLDPTPTDTVWEKRELPARERELARFLIPPGKFKSFALRSEELQQILTRAPKEFTAEARLSPAALSLPLPDGTFARFRIVESPIMEPELAAKFPQFKTYAGQGIDEPAATVRLSRMPDGLRAHIHSSRGIVQVRPVGRGELETHISYDLRDAAGALTPFHCYAEQAPEAGAAPAAAGAEFSPAASPPGVGSQLRVFRLAMAVTGEYTQRRGGTVESGMAAVVNTVNRLNAIFEVEAALRLVLVANNDRLVYTNPDTDPYTHDLLNFSGRQTARTQNQGNIDVVIGSANYDIGHLLDTGGGGQAFIGGLCQNAKASAVSGVPSPNESDDYWIYYVVPHEMGHQLGAQHSWNGLFGDCTPGEYASCCAYEPGSGTTIMSYSLNCGVDSLLVTNYYTDGYYHSGSFDGINSIVNNAACRLLVATGNNPPLVSAGGNYTIPARTPFTLTATGSDPEDDPLTYCWEERDLGPRAALADGDNGSSPLFRSYPAVPAPSRTFPRLVDILNNTTTPGEQLPTQSRTLRFRVTARDNRAGGGGRTASDMQVTVVGAAGPFMVTFPNAASTLSGTQTVSWAVAGTTGAPINAATVDILLSTNGGFDFPITLAANTPNDGEETVALPDAFSAQARIKIQPVGNIFFDISDTNFTLMPVSPWIVAAGATVLSEGCPPGNGAVDPAESVTLRFVLENLGGTAATNLTLSLLPSGGVLAPGPSQLVELLPSGGRSTNAFPFTADPGLACGGTLTATMRAQSGQTLLGDLAFPLRAGNLRVATSLFSNTNTIKHQFGAALQYPSAIVVSNLTDLVSKVTVTLSNVTHPSLGNQSVMLVGPQGQAVFLTYGAWAGVVTNLTLEFDDEAPTTLFEIHQAVSGRYKPTEIEPAEMFPLSPPAPPVPNAHGLSAFIGTNPNGIWRLYVFSLILATNQIANGWGLSITTSNTTCCSPLNLAVTHADSPDPTLVNESLTYTISVANSSPGDAHSVTLTNPLPGGVLFSSASASQGACEHSAGTVRCDLGTLPAGATATVSIQVVPTAPGVLANTVTVAHAGASSPPAVSSVFTTVQIPRSIYAENITVTEGDTGTTNAFLRLFLSEPAEVPVSVRYATANGTALAGADYLATNGLVTFAPLESVRTVTVRVVNNLLAEEAKLFLVTLSDPTNAVLAANSQGTATILDNDPVIALSGGGVTEGNVGSTGIVFTVSGSNFFNKTVTLNYTTTNGTATAGFDYAAQAGTLALSAINPVARLTIPVMSETLIEGDEDFFLLLNASINATLVTNRAAGIILNDDGLPGAVDHFSWAPVAPTQYVELPFGVTITARDGANQPATAFNGPVALAALGPGQERAVGATSVGTWTLPLQSSFHDSRLQSIFLASEVGATGRITALALDVVSVPGGTLSNWTLRLQHTARTNHPVAAWEGIGWTLVHQSHLSLTSTGWISFPFSTPFDYDGTNHLMVDFSFNNASSSTSGQCRYRSAALGRSAFSQINSTAGDPLAWSGTYAPVPGVSPRVPMLRLTIDPLIDLAPARSGAFAAGQWTGEVLLKQPFSSLTLLAADADGHKGVSNPFALELPSDLDGDGLPDPWEVRYFTSTNAPNSDPAEDPDHDGASNRDEFLAGTNPTNPASALLVLGIEFVGADVRLRFSSALGKRYHLERATTLAAQDWTVVALVEPGTGSPLQAVDPGGGNGDQRFYRIRVE